MIFSGIPVTVVMPVTAPIMKVENCKKMGAKVRYKYPILI
jgi:threonine dehydratase